MLINHLENIVKIAHVFGQQKAQMIKFELFIVLDNIATKLIVEPPIIFQIDNLILLAHKHSYWHALNLF